MSRLVERFRALLPARRLPAFLALLAVVALGSAAVAALRPKVENPHGTFREECGLCHGAEGWKPAKVSSKFDHGKFGFRLEGAHAATGCMNCHTSLQFAQSKTQCQSCHEDPHRGEMGVECARCHGARSFTDRAQMVRAHQMSRFPLTGGHAALDCESCHKPQAQGRLQYVGMQADCQSCHMEQYRTTRQPDHAAGGFPTTCQTCHGTTTWTNARFDHDRSAFPLTGAHRAAACANCHTNGQYSGLSTQCQTCHQSDYTSATPNHAASGFSAAACASCHNTTTWAGAAFDHGATSFPLTGAHRTATCNGCHSSGVYNGLSTQCQTCHMTDYNGATPNHASSGFSASACATCHNTTTWAGATFDHGATSFPLTGAHRTATCNGCHSSGVYNGLSTQCQSCHLTEYNSATPNHPSAGFAASACATCHNTTTWAGASFNHGTTSFPLTGAHVAAACNSCHGSGVYNGLSTQCQSCHQTDYNSATPNHAAAGFAASACASCHSTTTWAGATFNHGTTSFPLTGAHVAAACNSCHSSGVYNGLATACQSCHLTDYNSAVPNHASAGFSASACASCHNTTTWSGATFNHDTSFFPIYSGKHRGKWSDCATCHTSSTNYSVFTCLSCHPHSDRAKTDGDHRGENGYSYDSNACFRCHPRGNS